MGFIVDKQTLEDLNLLGKYKVNSVFKVFSETRTRGGERVLETMFQHPLNDAAQINLRSRIFQYFGEKKLTFPVDAGLFETAEHYFSNIGHGNAVVAAMNTCRRKFMHYIGGDKEYEMIYNGLLGTITFLYRWNDFFRGLAADVSGNPYQETLKEIERVFAHPLMKTILKENGANRLPLWKMIRYDHFLRATWHDHIEQIMRLIYECDVYMTVSEMASKYQFCYALAHPFSVQENRICIRNVFHPQLRQAVRNDIQVDHEQNVIFLTGANMAGKSTFMKSFAISVYLAHMGFPVAAGGMEFSVQDGMYTSINVPDNLYQGYSHFYAEVLRVKKVAEEVEAGKNLVIIFDELFKGTNVKDAYDATVAVTEAFSTHRNCSFIISTHITEAGHTLREQCRNFRFVYLPTIMRGAVPTYTYKLQEGITNDRHGMMIIQNEHILDIISGKEKPRSSGLCRPLSAGN